MRSQAPKVRRNAIAGIAFSAIAFVGWLAFATAGGGATQSGPNAQMNSILLTFVPLVPFVAQLVVFFILLCRISSFESSTAGSALSPMAQPVVQPVVQQVAQPALQPAMQVQPAIQMMQVQPAMQMMQVQVPPGVASGGAFMVATPGGGQVQVTVPAGATAGQMMQIQVPVPVVPVPVPVPVPMAQPVVMPMQV